MQELEPLQITTILWSFGKLNYNPGIELMEVLLAAVSLNVGQFATQVCQRLSEIVKGLLSSNFLA